MRMKSIITMFALLFAFTLVAQAQDEINKFEASAGYSWLHTDTGFDEDLDDLGDFDLDSQFNSHGFNGSLTGNVHRYVGVKFDYSYHSRSRNFLEGPENFSASLRTNQFLGGLQFKDNRKEGGRVRPFAHVLAGVANQNFSASGTIFDPTPTIGGTPTIDIDESISSNNFAMVFGGGIDVKVHPRIDLRLIQVDYNPIFFRDQFFEDLNLPGRTQNNFRIGVGIVFH